VCSYSDKDERNQTFILPLMISNLFFLPLPARKPCIMSVWEGTPQTCLTDLNEDEVKAYVSSCVDHDILKLIIEKNDCNAFAIHGRSGRWERERSNETGVHAKEFAIHLAVDLISPDMFANVCKTIFRRKKAGCKWKQFSEVFGQVMKDGGTSFLEQVLGQPTLVHLFGTYIPTTSITSRLCHHVCNVISKAKASQILDLEWGVVCKKEDGIVKIQPYILPGVNISGASDVEVFPSYLPVRRYLYGFLYEEESKLEEVD